MSSTPSSCSSFLIWVDSVGWLTKQASAARPKWRWSATATRYRRSRRFIGPSCPRCAAHGSTPAREPLAARRASTRLGARPGPRCGSGGRRRCSAAVDAGAHRDHDLLERHGGAVAGGEHARAPRSRPRSSMTISPRGDSSTVPSSHSVFGSRPICTKTPSRSTVRALAGRRGPRRRRPVTLLAVAEHLGGQRADDDVDVGQAAQLALQHLVGAQRVVELDQGDVARRCRPGRSPPRRRSCRRRSPRRACP